MKTLLRGIKAAMLAFTAILCGNAWAEIGDAVSTNNVGKGGYGASTFNNSSETYSFVVPTSETVVAGSPVCIRTVSFGMNSSSDAAKTPKYLKINGKMSAIVNGTGNQVTNVKFGNNSLKQTYMFTGLVLTAGETYAAEFCSDAAGTKMGEMRWYMVNSEEAAPFVQSLTSSGWRITQEITGWQVEQETVVFDQGVLPNTTELARFSSTNWAGAVWIKNYGTVNNQNICASCLTGLKSYGNANSIVKFSGVKGYTPNEAATCPYELVLENDTFEYAWKNDSGWSGKAQHVFAKLSGTGKFVDTYQSCTQEIIFSDVGDFSGAFDIKGKKITLGGTSNATTANGQIAVAEGTTAKIAANKAWTAGVGGILVNGTLNVDAAASKKGHNGKLVVSSTGTLNIAQSDWFNYDIGSAHSTEIYGTVNLGTTRQTLKANNQITLYPGAQLNGTDAGVDGGCHLNFFNAGAILKMAAGGTGTEATVQASIGPQGAKLTVEVPEGLALNLAATAASTGSNGRSQGIIKTGDGVLKVTGKYNTLAGFTLNGGTIEVYEGASMPSAAIDTTAPGMQVKLIVEEGVTTYTLEEAEDSTVETTSSVSNRLSLPIVRLGNGGVQKFTGVGGVLIDDLQIRNGGKIVVNPTRQPIKLSKAPVFEEGAKIALADEHASCKLGKFTLMTWVGDAVEIPEGLFDSSSFIASTTLVCEAAPESGCHQLTLTIGNYEDNATVIRIMPLGDSITDGTSYYANQYEANPNYRVPLMQKLAARGYKPVAKGLRECAFTQRYATDASGVAAPSEYRWHSGVSGARVRTASTGAARGLNGGWREAIETTLDAAGDIDIITFKIGTNDAGNDKDLVFAGWKDVMTRILNARPKVKIVCASILNMNGDGTWEKNYNKLIEDEIAKTEAEGGFPADRVFFVDLYNSCPRTTDGVSNFADGLHPNWIGHDRNSDAWLVGVEKAIETMTFPTEEDTFEKNTQTGAENNVPETYREGYVKLATTALPTTSQGSAMQNAAPEYDTLAEGAADKALERVAYYVELKNKKTGHVRYVWTSMDAFGDKTLATVGLPTSYAKWGEVTNLRVVSNDSGIHNTTADAEGITGRLQFTYGGVSYGAQSGVTPAALIAKWDWNDTMNGSEETPNGTYGVMQVYRVFDNPETDHNVAETLFAYNRWTATDNKPTEIGIGNFAMHGAYTGGDTSNGSINYMFTSGYETVDASAYEVMNLEIWGMEEKTWPGEEELLAAGDWSTKVDYNSKTASFMTGDGKTAWMTNAGDEGSGTANRKNNANGTDVVATTYHATNYDKWHPNWQPGIRSDFTIAAYVDLSEVTISDSKTYGSIWCYGSNGGSEVILAIDAAGNLYAGNFSGGTPVEGATAKIDASLIGEGYHLVTVEFSTTWGTKLTLDDGTPVMCAAAKTAISNNGFQIGSIRGGIAGQTGRAENVGISDVYYYDGLLKSGALATLVEELGAKYYVEPEPEPEYDPDNDAAIGETKYASLDDAVKALQSGETVRLLRDVTLERSLWVNGGKTGTIDLNGYSITVESDEDGCIIEFAQGSTMTLTGRGTVEKETLDYAIKSAGWTTISGVNGTPKLGNVIAVPSARSKVSFTEDYNPSWKIRVCLDWTGCKSNATTPGLGYYHGSSYNEFIEEYYDPIQKINDKFYEGEFHAGYFGNERNVTFNYLYSVSEVTMAVSNATVAGLSGLVTDPDTEKMYGRISKVQFVGSYIQEDPLPAGYDVNFIVRPDSGYHNPKVMVNGVELEANQNGWYHLMPAASVTAIVVTAEEIPTVPSWVDSGDSAAVEKYNTWAQKAGVTDPSAAIKAAFAFNCANTDKAVEDEEAAFVVTSIEIVDGVPKVTAKMTNLTGEEYLITPVIRGSATVNGDYNLDQNNPDAKFFKAVIDL